MRYAIVADLHLGAPKRFNVGGSRTQAMVDAATAAVKSAAQENCDVIIFAGDFLDKRRSIETPVLQAARQILWQATDLFHEVYLLEGNHEYLEEHASVLYALTFNEKIFVVKQDARYLDDDFVLIPYRKDIESVLTVANKRAKQEESFVVVSHFAAVGASVSSAYTLPDGVDTSVYPHITKFILGDIHKRQRIKTGRSMVYYVGAPLQHNFGEVDYATGYVIYDTDECRVHYMKVDVAPKFFKYAGVSEENALPLIKTINPRNFYWFACVSRASKEFVESRLAETVQAVVTVEQHEREGVRLESVKHNRGLLHIFKEYVSVCRKDIPITDRSALLSMFKRTYHDVLAQQHEGERPAR